MASWHPTAAQRNLRHRPLTNCFVLDSILADLYCPAFLTMSYSRFSTTSTSTCCTGAVGLLAGLCSQLALAFYFQQYPNDSGYSPAVWFGLTLIMLWMGFECALMIAQSKPTPMRLHFDDEPEIQLMVNRFEATKRREETGLHEAAYGSLALVGITTGWIALGGDVILNVALLLVSETIVLWIVSVRPCPLHVTIVERLPRDKQSTSTSILYGDECV